MHVFIQISFLIIMPKGSFVWDKCGRKIIGIMRVNVCLGAILIPEYLNFHDNSLHLARKYARIFVRRHYLFREATSFPRALGKL